MPLGLALGYLSLITAQITIGVNVTIGKFLLDVMPIYIFLGLRFFISAVGLHLALSSQGALGYRPITQLERLKEKTGLL